VIRNVGKLISGPSMTFINSVFGVEIKHFILGQLGKHYRRLSRNIHSFPCLTGVWKGDDRGTYYIHQPHGGINAPILWLGLSPGGGRPFTNVFIDNMSGGIIQGR
jgi:hypothetical protein